MLGWASLYLVSRDHWSGYVLALLTTFLAMVIMRRAHDLAEEQKERYRVAYESAEARSRELDRLASLAATLLKGTDIQALFREIAQAASDLLQAEAGVITLVVEEGRFLKVVAATGPLTPASGSLLPVDASLCGWVVAHEQPLVSENMDADPRSFALATVTSPLSTVAIVPLRSSEVVIGTVSVHNRHNGSFGPHDLQLLRTLGEQAVIGLDRAHVLEESRKNERALAAKNTELQRATQLKNEFLANMSHELRTPLNSIIGFSDLILSGAVGPVNEQQEDFLGAILRNGRHLLGLINSVLDLSKIEAGRMTLELAPTDLRNGIKQAVADTSSLRTAKHQECAVQMDESTPLMILGDDQRVRQVLFNLLSNASKFTPDHGTITLSAIRTRAPLPVPAERTGEQPKLMTREAVWVSVIDTGVGIKMEDMPKLFQEFSQVDTSASRRAQGTGLGLALCRKFVEAHGGTIGAESIYGTGSTFWFILPTEGPVRRAGSVAQ
jgi:signal transduction histidine kinase